MPTIAEAICAGAVVVIAVGFILMIRRSKSPPKCNFIGCKREAVVDGWLFLNDDDFPEPARACDEHKDHPDYFVKGSVER